MSNKEEYIIELECRISTLREKESVSDSDKRSVLIGELARGKKELKMLENKAKNLITKLEMVVEKSL